MSRRSVGFRVDEDLWGRVESRAAELGQSKTTFLERALRKALGDPVVVPAPSAAGEKLKAAYDEQLERAKAEARQALAEEPPFFEEADELRHRPVVARTEPQLFKCPACEFRAPSPNARCRDHGYKVR